REVEEVDAARRASARIDVHAFREARRRGDVVTQAVDKAEGRRRAILARPDHVHVEVAAARVDVLRSLPESHRGHLWIRAETLLELADRCTHAGRFDASCTAGVPDDRGRGEGALADGVRDHVKPIDTPQVWG